MSFYRFITRAHPVTSLASFRSSWHDLTAPPDPITDWYKRVRKRRREEGTACVTRLCASEYTVLACHPFSLLLDYFGPDTFPAA